MNNLEGDPDVQEIVFTKIKSKSAEK
jgi:hypothetical protein